MTEQLDVGAAAPASAAGSSPRSEFVVRQVLAPVAIFAANRLVQFVLLALLARPGQSVYSRLSIWDADFFLRIARDGYDHALQYDGSGHLIGNTLAFFPGYPLCVRFVALFGVPYAAAGVVVSLLAGAAGTVLIHLLGRRLRGERFGYVLAVLFCAQPMSVVFSMAYSEALFCALVLAMLLSLHRQQWLLAGAFAVAAGLTRSTGLAAAVALACYAGYRLWADRRLPGAPRVRPVVAAVAGLAAVPGFWFWVGQRLGRADGWFVEQSQGWGTGVDWGAASLRFVADTFRNADGFVQLATALLLVFSGALVLWALLDRTDGNWWPVALYGLLAYGTVAGASGYFNSRPRLLVPVLSVLLPVGGALLHARTRVLVPCLVAVSLVGCWFGAYMITVWPYTI
ncbi:mannosyltransferase family protein [Actinocatenispora comari]|uniref:Membrane protein n=1 Tax=Actinocatenispora comari TaxID=2807577 RepID=A0A8J4EPD3_9ACTN|nr:mannosyltransferase family protein [Actinocatenispora comari]GIL31240.1 membrane protein [Actinocatenispora comari]